MDGFCVSGKDHWFFAEWIDAVQSKCPHRPGGFRFRQFRLCERNISKQAALARIQFVVANAIGLAFLQRSKQQQCSLTLLNGPRLNGVCCDVRCLALPGGHRPARLLAGLDDDGDVGDD
jgi:hypothetical protein